MFRFACLLSLAALAVAALVTTPRIASEEPQPDNSIPKLPEAGASAWSGGRDWSPCIPRSSR